MPRNPLVVIPAFQRHQPNKSIHDEHPREKPNKLRHVTFDADGNRIHSQVVDISSPSPGRQTREDAQHTENESIQRDSGSRISQRVGQILYRKAGRGLCQV